MTETWVQKYQRYFWVWFMSAMQVEDKDPSIYGWSDYRETVRLRKHLKDCSLNQEASVFPTEEHWYEFAGTFASSDNSVLGLIATFTCTCGEFTNVKVRANASLHSSIQGVLAVAEAEEGPVD